MSHFFCFYQLNLLYLLAKWSVMNNKILANGLRLFADNIDAGNTNASEDELIEICDMIGFMTNPESKLSKYQAIKFLGISRATFDNYVRDGKIPKGMEQQGFKEKFWYKRDLVKFKESKNEN